MGNRDHLVPSLTVDRNGHTKTVYVAPQGGSSRSSSLSSVVPTLTRFAEHGSDEDDYEEDESGFGAEWEGVSDPDSWEANHFDADDAQDWTHAGFDADDAYGWREAGFDFNDAREWVGAGFDASESKEWGDAGFDADDAQTWNNAGFAPASASEWREHFDGASTAFDWSNEGFDPREATEWHEAGFEDAATAGEWKSGARGRRGIEISDLVVLHENNLLAEDAPQWLAVFDAVQGTPEGKGESLQGLVHTLEGVNPSAGDAYLNIYPYSQKWRTLASAGIEWDKVKSVQKACTLIDEFQQDEYGDDYEEDEDWTLEEATKWIGQAEGFNPKKATAINALITKGHRASEFDVFLANSSRIEYDDNSDAIIKAQQWAVTVAGPDSTMQEKTESFEQFYTALRSIEDMDGIVEKHGAAKVEKAMKQGMLTGPTLRNYLDYIPVAGISEGAL